MMGWLYLLGGGRGGALQLLSSSEALIDAAMEAPPLLSSCA